MKNKVVLILIDGMRPDGTAACGNDAFQALMQAGTSCFHARTVMPSMTLPCHASLFFSVEPERHGITDNTWHPMVRPIESIADVVKKFGGKTAMFYNWEELRDLNRPGSLDFSRFQTEALPLEAGIESEDALTDAAIDYIVREQPDFTFLYLGYTDCAGHDCGWMSPEYLRALAHALDCVRRVHAALPAGYSLALTADHGGHGRMHGEDIPEDMTIPVVFAGAPFEAGRALESLSIKDIAPTLLGVLGLPQPAAWEGRSIL